MLDVITPKYYTWQNFKIKKYILYFLQLFAHEVGHVLGMKHDFKDPYSNKQNNPEVFRKTWTTGNLVEECTNTNSIMDYEQVFKKKYTLEFVFCKT